MPVFHAADKSAPKAGLVAARPEGFSSEKGEAGERWSEMELWAWVGLACHVALAASLVVAAACDLRWQIVPNGCAGAVAISGLARSALAGCAGEALVGMIVVLLVLLVASWASRRASGRCGVGGGDVKLFSALGVWTGPAWGLVVVGASCLLGVIGWLTSRALARWGGASGRAAAHGTLPASEAPPASGENGIPMAPAIALAVLVCAFVRTLVET